MYICCGGNANEDVAYKVGEGETIEDAILDWAFNKSNMADEFNTFNPTVFEATQIMVKIKQYTFEKY